MNGTCKYGEEQLVTLLYEDDTAEAVEMRTHLATCADCRAELEELTSTRELLSAWPNVVNVPRMVYVNERTGVLDSLRRWIGELGVPAMGTMLKPVAAAAAIVVVVTASIALLDVRVAPDGRLQVGFGSAPQVTAPAASASTSPPFKRCGTLPDQGPTSKSPA